MLWLNDKQRITLSVKNDHVNRNNKSASTQFRVDFCLRLGPLASKFNNTGPLTGTETSERPWYTKYIATLICYWSTEILSKPADAAELK